MKPPKNARLKMSQHVVCLEVILCVLVHCVEVIFCVCPCMGVLFLSAQCFRKQTQTLTTGLEMDSGAYSERTDGGDIKEPQLILPSCSPNNPSTNVFNFRNENTKHS